jgi:hypothetical protein
MAIFLEVFGLSFGAVFGLAWPVVSWALNEVWGI